MPIELTVYAGAVFTAAFVLLVPIVLGGLARLAATVLYPILRVEGRIAERQVLRRRVRTTLTIGLLYIAVSTAISLGTTILNCVEDIRTWQAKTFKGDFIIRSMTPDLATGKMPPMPESLGGELRAINGVANVDSISLRRCFHARERSRSSDKQPVTVFIRDFTDQGSLPLALQEGDPAEVRQRLAAGEVVLGSVLANRTHTKVGDEITLDTDKGPQRLRVAGTATAYMQGGRVIYMEGQAARRHLGVEDVNTYIVNAVPGAQAKVQREAQADLRRVGPAAAIVRRSSPPHRRPDEGRGGQPVGALGPGLHRRLVRHRQHADDERAGTDPRVGLAPRGGHDPLAGPQDHPRPGGHHRLHRPDAGRQPAGSSART